MDDKLLISLIGLILSVATFFVGRTTAHRQAGEKSGYLASDIGYIKSGIDDLKTEIRSLKAELSEIRTKLAHVDESTKSAHRRIDELIQQIRSDGK